MNREEKEIEHYMEGYIAFMRTCEFVASQRVNILSYSVNDRITTLKSK